MGLKDQDYRVFSLENYFSLNFYTKLKNVYNFSKWNNLYTWFEEKFKKCLFSPPIYFKINDIQINSNTTLNILEVVLDSTLKLTQLVSNVTEIAAGFNQINHKTFHNYFTQIIKLVFFKNRKS